VQSAPMVRINPTLPLLAAAALLLSLGGCATTREQQWGVSGGDREHGVVRVSYEYPEFHQPMVSDEQALQIAVNRCNGWGFEDAQLIAGQLRQCSNKSGSNCDQWTVTREYQCTANASFAGNLSK